MYFRLAWRCLTAHTSSSRADGQVWVTVVVHLAEFPEFPVCQGVPVNACYIRRLISTANLHGQASVGLPPCGKQGLCTILQRAQRLQENDHLKAVLGYYHDLSIAQDARNNAIRAAIAEKEKERDDYICQRDLRNQQQWERRN